MQTVSLRITGKVQGVWYRGWTIEVARDLNLDGWVCNCRDGSVEARVVGTPDKIKMLIDACRNGPGSAAVRDVIVSDNQDGDPDILAGQGFQQRRTI